MSIRFWTLVLSTTLACCKPTLALELTSPTIAPGGTVPAAQRYSGFGCAGGNLSPALEWRDVPSGTHSFALTLYDPDAPTGSGWWHWVLIDMPARTRALPAGAGAADGAALPAGAEQLRNDFGTRAYGGPCPPVGAPPHRYVFTLYALKVGRLPLPANASAAMAGFLIRADTIDSARLTVRYGR